MLLTLLVKRPGTGVCDPARRGQHYAWAEVAFYAQICALVEATIFAITTRLRRFVRLCVAPAIETGP